MWKSSDGLEYRVVTRKPEYVMFPQRGSGKYVLFRKTGTQGGTKHMFFQEVLGPFARDKVINFNDRAEGER